MTRQKALIVEDEEILRIGLREYLRCNDYDVVVAEDCKTAERHFKSARPNVAIIDYLLPDGTALDLLPRFKEIDPTVPLVVLTGHGTIDLAVRAVKEGADQFLAKPIEFPSLLVVLERTIENQRNRRRVAASSTAQPRRPVDPFAGESPAIRQLEEQARKIVAADNPVLILGETGTGKSVLARWVHENGPRAQEAFVDFNCAGLSKDLLDTELFGHEKGAFTGAAGSKLGLLEVAHRGTVFLDELGDMDPQVQPKLLKVLEEQRFRRVGSVSDRYVDIRLVAATHQDLDEAVRQKQFRSDLYFRISALPLVVPSLRDRGGDVVTLARSIVAGLANMEPSDVPFASDGERALRTYGWPGNIRELKNVLERAVLLRDRDFKDGFALTEKSLNFNTLAVRPSADESEMAQWSLSENERRHIIRVLDGQNGNVVEAARILNVSRSALYEKIRKHGIVAQR